LGGCSRLGLECKIITSKKKANTKLWTPNQHEVEMHVNALKAMMMAFDLEKLSDDQRMIFYALNNKFHDLIPNISLPLLLSLLCAPHVQVTYFAHIF
jgi:hypothetical protein